LNEDASPPPPPQEPCTLEECLRNRGYAAPRPLRSDGNAPVYRADDRDGSGRSVVLKLVRSAADFAAERRRHERLRGAAGIVALLDAFVARGHGGVIVTPLCAGGDLLDFVSARGAPLGAAEAAALLHTAGAAVAAAHGRGTVLGDLKPENICVLEPQHGIARGNVAVIDVGTALNVTAAYQPRGAGGGQPRHSEANDVFALGKSIANLLLFKLDSCADDVASLAALPAPARELLCAMLREGPGAQPRPSIAEVLAHPWVVAAGGG